MKDRVFVTRIIDTAIDVAVVAVGAWMVIEMFA